MTRSARNGPRCITALVHTLLEESPHRSCYERAAVINAWQECVPPNLRNHVRCGGFKDHTLYVVASTATFKHALLLVRKKLLAQLQQACGREIVHDIVIR